MAGFLGIDIGGTKTLVAVFGKDGEIKEKQKFPTPEIYGDFLKSLKDCISRLDKRDFIAAGAAVPGRLNRKSGSVLALGNLPWHNEPIQADLETITQCPVVIENDSKLAALSEALLIKDEFKKVLYITISTGISAGLIIDGMIDPEFADSESGHMLLEHKGKLQTWESFASGKAIVQKYGKRAESITDSAAWEAIAHNIALGVIDLVAVVQPEIILIGGGVGTHFDKFKEFLLPELKKYEMPLVPIPPVRMAKRPEEAVIYGCYELAKAMHGKAS